MDVFISWSGARSRALALQLHEWIKAVVQRSNPWMSERDIDVGQRWNEQISARLQGSHFGVICLTPENLNAPWLLFEAGALAKALDVARVVPVLLDLRMADLQFPLAQFQAVEANREGFFALVQSLNRALGEQQLPPTLLVSIFGGLWGSLEASLKSLPPAPVKREERSPRRSDRDVLEAVLDGVRSLQHQLSPQPHGGEPSHSEDWEDHFIRGVNLANSREGPTPDVAALRAYNDAIALIPPNMADNTRSRLYAYRGAILKRLGRLEESQQDLLLAHKWAREDREIDDAFYNLACVAALQERGKDALSLLAELFSRNPEWVSVVAASKYFRSLRTDPEFKRLITRSPWRS